MIIELIILVLGESRQILVEYLCLKIRNIISQVFIRLQCISGIVMLCVMWECEVLIVWVVFFSFGLICSRVVLIRCRLQVIYIIEYVSQIEKMVECRLCRVGMKLLISYRVMGLLMFFKVEFSSDGMNRNIYRKDRLVSRFGIVCGISMLQLRKWVILFCLWCMVRVMVVQQVMVRVLLIMLINMVLMMLCISEG